MTIWDKIDFLSSLLRKGTYPRGVEFLGAGSGNFYQCTMGSALALRGMKKRTKGNAKTWDFHVQRVDALLKIAKRGHLPYGR
jgi:hypothetical protein